MPDTPETQLIREATDIFLRLRDDPDNPSLRQERDAFLARGEAERTAYKKMLQAWQATWPGKPSGPSTLLSILVAAVIFAAGYMAFDPLRIALRADLSTRLGTASAQLTSGDDVVLDAGSALIDDTEQATRHVTLLRGAAYFDVASGDSRPFIVTAGDMRVAVTGTAFEVSQFDATRIVTVTEGSVDVTIDDQTWQLEPGNHLSWSKEAGVRVTDTNIAEVAGWRDDTLVANGMTFAEIAAILDRRIAGEFLITSAALAQTSIVGTFDLTDPVASLDLLTALTGSKATHVPYVMTIIRP